MAPTLLLSPCIHTCVRVCIGICTCPTSLFAQGDVAASSIPLLTTLPSASPPCTIPLPPQCTGCPCACGATGDSETATDYEGSTLREKPALMLRLISEKSLLKP